MRLFTGMLALVGLLGLAGPAMAEAIDCPLSQVRREITTPMPSGWWNTPIISNLSETRVQTIGGQPALMCIYGPSGSIQRNAPENQTCTARTGGFDCRPNVRLMPVPLPMPGAGVHSQGDVALRQTYMLDLETGAAGAGADIWFQADTASLIYLSPRNGARFWPGDLSLRGRAGCSAPGHYTTDRISLSDLPAGSNICVRTNEGRIAEIRVTGLSGASPRTLSLHYTTWE